LTDRSYLNSLVVRENQTIHLVPAIAQNISRAVVLCRRSGVQHHGTAEGQGEYSGAVWTEYKPVFVKDSEALVEKWSKVALSFLDSLPTDKAEIKSSDLKKAIGARSLSRPTWKRVVDAVECFTSHRRLSSGGSKNNLET
jgi:hypothetical protein